MDEVLEELFSGSLDNIAVAFMALKEEMQAEATKDSSRRAREAAGDLEVAVGKFSSKLRDSESLLRD